jgi:hypothetical protein
MTAVTTLPCISAQSEPNTKRVKLWKLNNVSLSNNPKQLMMTISVETCEMMWCDVEERLKGITSKVTHSWINDIFYELALVEAVWRPLSAGPWHCADLYKNSEVSTEGTTCRVSATNSNLNNWPARSSSSSLTEGGRTVVRSHALHTGSTNRSYHAFLQGPCIALLKRAGQLCNLTHCTQARPDLISHFCKVLV